MISVEEALARVLVQEVQALVRGPVLVRLAALGPLLGLVSARLLQKGYRQGSFHRSYLSPRPQAVVALARVPASDSSISTTLTPKRSPSTSGVPIAIALTNSVIKTSNGVGDDILST